MTNMVTGGAPSLSASEATTKLSFPSFTSSGHAEASCAASACCSVVNIGGVDGADYFLAGAHHCDLAGGHARHLLGDRRR